MANKVLGELKALVLTGAPIPDDLLASAYKSTCEQEVDHILSLRASDLSQNFIRGDDDQTCFTLSEDKAFKAVGRLSELEALPVLTDDQHAESELCRDVIAGQNEQWYSELAAAFVDGRVFQPGTLHAILEATGRDFADFRADVESRMTEPALGDE